MRAAAGGLALGRLGIGLGLVLLPRTAATAWLGDAAGDEEPTRVAVRALGGREIALGIGALTALGEGRVDEARRWLGAGVGSDVLDAVLTIASDRPVTNRVLVTTMAAAGAGAGAVITSRPR